MKKIGLMGGTFDPIHSAHIEIAKRAKEQYSLDAVIFMTSGNPPHKSGKNVLDAAMRHEMVKQAICDIDGFYASDYEVKKEGYSYSVETLKWLKGKCPEAEIYFLLGEDSLDYIDKWYKPRELLSLCTLLVYPRLSMETLRKTAVKKQAELGGNILIIDAPIYDISSTNLRRDISTGNDVSHIMDGRVLRYIDENKLYGSDSE